MRKSNVMPTRAQCWPPRRQLGNTNVEIEPLIKIYYRIIILYHIFRYLTKGLSHNLALGNENKCNSEIPLDGFKYANHYGHLKEGISHNMNNHLNH